MAVTLSTITSGDGAGRKADFIAHAGEPIELTATGLKRVVASHVAGHDVVIEIDGRDGAGGARTKGVMHRS
jgi:hypothetical protein